MVAIARATFRNQVCMNRLGLGRAGTGILPGRGRSRSAAPPGSASFGLIRSPVCSKMGSIGRPTPVRESVMRAISALGFLAAFGLATGSLRADDTYDLRGPAPVKGQ